METIPVLFDTDIGNDIDDAVALAYLLRQPCCELLGITTVTGHTGQRAALADAICQAAGRTDVPIHAGLTGPLLTGRGQPEVPHFDAIAASSPRLDYGAPGDAIEFLRRTIRSRPGEITLLAVGPMTNVGALFAADPEIPGLLNQLVLMCGVFTGRSGHGPGACEWNALVDPFSTALVYHHAPAGRFLSIGLDVTEKCRLPADECRARFTAAGGPLASVLEMAEVFFARQGNKITFHDPLAAAVIFQPDLVTTGPGSVRVFTDEGPIAGLTRWTPTENGPHRVAYTVDPERFFAEYFAVVGG